MPYNTEYDRMIAREVQNIVNRQLSLQEHQENTLNHLANITGGNGFANEPEYIEVLGPKPKDNLMELVAKERKRRGKGKAVLGATENSKPKKGGKKTGKGLLSGIVGMLGLGKEEAKEEAKEGGSAFMTPQEKLNRIVQEGGAIPASAAEKRIIGGKKRGRKPKAQTNKDKEDEKMSMEIKGLKDNETKKGSGIISGIIGALGLGKEGEGAKEYKKKGGRKLLLKEEMPVSQMSGLGKKANPWMSHLAAFRKEHPEFKGKKLMEEAKKSYKK